MTTSVQQWMIVVGYLCQLAQGFHVVLSMWTQGQVHVLHSGQQTELDCEFYGEDFNMFSNPVIWRKHQRQESTEINIMGNIQPPFFTTNRFQVTLISTPPRYRLKLKISELSLEDSGNYTCEVRGAKSSVMASVTHYLFIRAPVQQLYFQFDNTRPTALVPHSLTPITKPLGGRGGRSVTFTEDQPGTVRCTSLGGYPPPDLQIFLGELDVTSQFSLYSTATLYGTKGLRLMIYQTERWTDRLTLRAEDDQKELKCFATVSSLPANHSTAIVNIRYGPIAVCPPVEAYLGEKNVHISCRVRSRPGLTILFWIIDDNGTTVTEGEVRNEYWTLLMDPSDDALDTQLYMRKVRETSFRRYQLFAENVISARSTEVELIQKWRDTTTTKSANLLIDVAQQRRANERPPYNPSYSLISSHSQATFTTIHSRRFYLSVTIIVWAVRILV